MRSMIASTALTVAGSGIRLPARISESTSSAAWLSFSKRGRLRKPQLPRSEEHTSELQSLMRISYAVFCLTKKKRSTETEQYHKSATKIQLDKQQSTHATTN